MTSAPLFERKPAVYTLAWDDGPYVGLVVKANALPMGELLKIMPVAEDIQSGKATPEMLGEVIRQFGSCLISWNLADNGKPVPCTHEALMREDPEFTQALFQEWMKAQNRPDPTSKPGSLPGATEEAPMQIPMTPLPGN